MPARSKAQFRFMQALAHNPKLAKEHGMKSSQAAEYVEGQSPKGLREKIARRYPYARKKK